MSAVTRAVNLINLPLSVNFQRRYRQFSFCLHIIPNSPDLISTLKTKSTPPISIDYLKYERDAVFVDIFSTFMSVNTVVK